MDVTPGEVAMERNDIPAIIEAEFGCKQRQNDKTRYRYSGSCQVLGSYAL